MRDDQRLTQQRMDRSSSARTTPGHEHRATRLALLLGSDHCGGAGASRFSSFTFQTYPRLCTHSCRADAIFFGGEKPRFPAREVERHVAADEAPIRLARVQLAAPADFLRGQATPGCEEGEGRRRRCGVSQQRAPRSGPRGGGASVGPTSRTAQVKLSSMPGKRNLQPRSVQSSLDLKLLISHA